LRTVHLAPASRCASRPEIREAENPVVGALRPVTFTLPILLLLTRTLQAPALSPKCWVWPVSCNEFKPSEEREREHALPIRPLLLSRTSHSCLLLPLGLSNPAKKGRENEQFKFAAFIAAEPRLVSSWVQALSKSSNPAKEGERE
jgi:hypothetical protein